MFIAMVKLIIFNRLKILSIVEYPFLNPAYPLLKILFSSTHRVNQFSNNPENNIATLIINSIPL